MMTVFLMYACGSILQPPPRRPVAYAEQHESDEEKQFRRVFQQLAGDVSLPLCTSPFTCVGVLFCFAVAILYHTRSNFVVTVWDFTHDFHGNCKCGLLPEQTLLEQLLGLKHNKGAAGIFVYISTKETCIVLMNKSVKHNYNHLISCSTVQE